MIPLLWLAHPNSSAVTGALPPCRQVQSTAHHNHGPHGLQMLPKLLCGRTVRALVEAHQEVVSQSAGNIHGPGAVWLMFLP